MAQKVALMYRDKEEVIEEIDLLVADTMTMTADERPRKTVLNKVRELAMAYRQKANRPECNVGTQTGHDSWLGRVVRTGMYANESLVSGCCICLVGFWVSHGSFRYSLPLKWRASSTCVRYAQLGRRLLGSRRITYPQPSSEPPRRQQVSPGYCRFFGPAWRVNSLPDVLL